MRKLKSFLFAFLVVVTMLTAKHYSATKQQMPTVKIFAKIN